MKHQFSGRKSFQMHFPVSESGRNSPGFRKIINHRNPLKTNAQEGNTLPEVHNGAHAGRKEQDNPPVGYLMVTFWRISRIFSKKCCR